MKPAKRNPVEATVDSVGSAISMLWDWLGAEPEHKEEPPDVIGMLTGSVKLDEREAIDAEGEDAE